MRILYFDIDTLRADHLGCYGYGRATSPNIDELATAGIRFTNVYASDTPCLPSRTALTSGQFGIRNGVVGHGGTAAIRRDEGSDRGFRSLSAGQTWPSLMQRAGLWTASISTFAERHSAYHFLAGFNESYNIGTRGLETADQVSDVAMSWLDRHADRPDWFLHVHMWDPHTPYRTPDAFGSPFEGVATPGWLTEEVRAQHWLLPGPHSAQEISGFGPRTVWDRYPRQPKAASDMIEVRRMFDGYDTGVRYADHYVGLIMARLQQMGIYDDVAVIVSADHGETLGELGIYCDHQTADEHVANVPMIIKWPGMASGVDDRLWYQMDVAATVIELLGGHVPASWDGRPFALTSDSDRGEGRPHLVLSQGAWTAQRSVRFDQWICIRTYHDGYHGFPEVMLFDLGADPHEQFDLAPGRPDVVATAMGRLESWREQAMSSMTTRVDPLETVLAEGGPWHASHCPPWYLKRLRDTDRAGWADRLASARNGDTQVGPSYV
jgi:choline-sulfatase